MKSILKYYFGLAVLIIFFGICGGKEYDFIKASEIGATVSTYLSTHHPTAKVTDIQIQDHNFKITLDDGFVVVCDGKGNCRQDTSITSNH